MYWPQALNIYLIGPRHTRTDREDFTTTYHPGNYASSHGLSSKTPWNPIWRTIIKWEKQLYRFALGSMAKYAFDKIVYDNCFVLF